MAEHSIKEQASVWLSKGYTNNQIKEELLGNGVDERYIPDMLKEITKLRNSKKTTNGLILILIGATVCLASCILTITSQQPASGFTLYGLTSIGIIVAFAGLMKIFN